VFQSATPALVVLLVDVCGTTDVLDMSRASGPDGQLCRL